MSRIEILENREFEKSLRWRKLYCDKSPWPWEVVAKVVWRGVNFVHFCDLHVVKRVEVFMKPILFVHWQIKGDSVKRFVAGRNRWNCIDSYYVSRQNEATKRGISDILIFVHVRTRYTMYIQFETRKYIIRNLVEKILGDNRLNAVVRLQLTHWVFPFVLNNLFAEFHSSDCGTSCREFLFLRSYRNS